MAEFTIPAAYEPLVDTCSDAALPAFQGADFANDPGAAFSEGMSAAMDVMADAGMPAPMMEMMQDFCSGAFEQHMAGGDPMDAFDAVGKCYRWFDGPLPQRYALCRHGCRLPTYATRYGGIYGRMPTLW